MFFNKSCIQKHQYKIIKQIQIEDGQDETSTNYLVYRRIRWFGLWFWWNHNFNYYTMDSVNYNNRKHLTVTSAKDHIQWVINLDQKPNVVVIKREDVTNQYDKIEELRYNDDEFFAEYNK